MFYEWSLKDLRMLQECSRRPIKLTCTMHEVNKPIQGMAPPPLNEYYSLVAVALYQALSHALFHALFQAHC